MSIVRFCFIVLMCVLNLSILAQDPDIFTSVNAGVWNDNTGSTPWNYTGSDLDGIPDNDDTVVVNHSITCASNQNSLIAVIRINSGGSITLDPSYRLQVWGQNQNSVISGGGINGPGRLNFVRRHTVSGNGTINNVNLQLNNWYCTFDLDIVASQVYLTSGSGFELLSGNTMTINGSFYKVTSPQRVQNDGTFVINDPNFMTLYETPEDEFYSLNGNIIYNATGDFPIPFDGGYTDVIIGGTATSDGDLSISGDFTNNGTFNSSNDDNLTFSGSSLQTIAGSGTSNLKNLTLNNSNGLTLSSGAINISNALISTSGTITQNGANITLVSNSSNTAGLVKLNTASDYSYSSGDFTVQRYYNGTQNGWRMVAAPIKSATLADWDDEFIYCGIPGGTGNYSYNGCGNFYSVYSYDESSANPGINDGLSEVTSLAYGVSNATGTLIYTSSGATTLSVTGTPEFDDIAKSVTNNNAGWNLVANPYPSTIEWSAFTSLNSNITGNVWYAYSADAATYLSNSSNIPHSQGFWINSSSSTNLNFSVSETVANQANFYKSTNGINLPLKLKLTNNVNSYFDFAYLKTGPNYSNDFESDADALKLFTPYPDYNANIYFLDNQGNSLDRSSINNNYSEDVFFDVKIGQFASGNYTIEFENLKQFMIGSCLQLEDLHSGIITDLRQDSIYTFASDTNAPTPRFKLQITVDYDINVSNAMCFNDSSAFVSIKGTNLQGHYFSLIDTSGLLIDSLVAVSDTILFGGLNAGVFQYETNHVGTCPTNNQLIYVTEPEEVISLFSTISDTFYLDTSNQISINFRNLSTGSTYYEWDLGDGNSSDYFSVDHTYTSPGTYSVKLISKMDSVGTCVDQYEKLIYIINPLSSVVDDFFDLINVFQNQNVLKIEFGANKFDYCYLNDILGKRITNKIKREEDSSTLTVSIPTIKSGVYFISFKLNDGSIFTRKIFLK